MRVSAEHRTEIGEGRWIAAQLAGSGPAALLLHGIPGAGAVWREVSRLLWPRFRVVVPDLVGFGESARTRDIHTLWADAQAAAVLTLLEDLRIERVLIVGHDFGGPVAAHLIARAPERAAGLVLASTNAFGDTPIPFPLSGILWPAIGRIWERMLFSAPSLRMMVKQGVGDKTTQLDPKVYVGDHEQAQAIRTIFAAALRDLSSRYDPITAMLRQVEVPTKVLWGDRDPFFPVEQAHRTAELIRGARTTVFPGAGHFLPEETPAEMVAEIEALWREVETTASEKGDARL
jgi:pimeloyl-ACP methyl ester carboxylesterase